ncbi:MAG: DUF308 domain-containing protein [Anaeroplasmataceae bacterium]|nr:DUF308 domain-containing protein [Anaeroplasmataceae bacterium]
MKKFLDSILHPSKTKWFWGYILLGILALLLGIMLMPIWTKAPDWVFWKNWGRQIVNLIICACIIAYLVLYLQKKVRQRSNSVVKVLTIIEFVLLSLIAIGCIVQHFGVNIGGPVAIIGLILWCRGTVEIFRAYYHQHGDDDHYPIWWLVIAVLMVSFGVYFFVAQPFRNSDLIILWTFVSLILLCALILIVDGFLAKPASNKEKKSKPSKKQEKSDE